MKFFLLVLFIASLNLSSCLIQVKAATQIIEIKAIRDAYTHENYPDTNFGSNNSIDIMQTGWKRHGFLYFDVSSMENQNYSSVMLRFYVHGSTATTLQVFPADSPWNEELVTWNMAPNVYLTPLCSQYYPVGLGYRYINVTSIVSIWTTEFIPNFGFCLRTTI